MFEIYIEDLSFQVMKSFHMGFTFHIESDHQKI